MSTNTGGLPASFPPPSPCLPWVRHLRAAVGASVQEGKTHAGGLRRTTVRLEPEFWRAIDRLAADSGTSWRRWAEEELASKPAGRGAASWLRTRCLDHFIGS